MKIIKWGFIVLSISAFLWGCLGLTDDNKNADDVDSTAILDSIAQAEQDSIDDYIADSIAAFVADSIEQAVADSIEQAIADSIEQHIADSIAVFVADSIEQFIADSIANSFVVIDIDGDSIADDTVTVEDPVVIDLDGTSTIDSSGLGFLITTESKSECEDGVLTTQDETDTTYYLIEDGKLYTWQEFDCSMVVYTGTSETVQGVWTTDFETVERPLLDTCTDSEMTEILPYMLNREGTATITETSVEFTTSADVCMAPFFADNVLNGGGIFGENGGDSGQVITNVVVDGCTDITYLTNMGSIDSVPVAISITDKDDDEMTLSTTLGNCTVTQDMPKFEPTAANCKVPDQTFDDEAMETCLVTWIFENRCLVDMFIEEMQNDTTPADTSDPVFEKVDCNTLQAPIISNDTDTLYLVIQFILEGGELNSRTSFDTCVYVGAVDSAFENEEWDACVEQVITDFNEQKRITGVPAAKRSYRKEDWFGRINLPGIKDLLK